MKKIGFWHSASVSVFLSFLFFAIPVLSADQTIQFNVPAQSATTGIPELARQAGIQILVSEELVSGKRTTAVVGTFSVHDALKRLLTGTGLAVSTKDERTFTLAPSTRVSQNSAMSSEQASHKESEDRQSIGQRSSGSMPELSKKEDLEEIVVTGTHIHNVTPISPVMTITHDQLVREGYTTIAEAIEQLPQNFLGAASPAANPASGFGGKSGTNNLTFASGINLRGLGPNATLVLLNGRRVAPAAYTGAVDISEIPINVIDRIEILTDGASSVYGADAVAGVVNIITRQNFSGVQVGAGLTGISKGKAPDNNANVMGGTAWSGGGLVVSAGFEKDNPLYARNRDFTAQLSDPWELTPRNETVNLYLNLHQELSDGLTLSSDVFATRRNYHLEANVFGVYGPGYLPTDYSGRVNQYNAALELDYRISSEWNLAVIGQASKEEERNGQIYASFGSFSEQPGDYRVASLESRIDGKLFDAPGGAARVAIGAQFHREDLAQATYQNDIGSPGLPSEQQELSRHEWSAYGEFVLPLIGKDNAGFLAQELRVDLSGRYDNYSDFGHTFNPRVGLLWKPVSGVTLHGSYARSFQVPTLYETLTATQNGDVILLADPKSPSGSTLTLLTGGGNPNLEPEKARSLNFGVSYEPAFASGIKVDASYFSIHFDNRIITLNDLGIYTDALQRASILGSLVERNPSLSQIIPALNVPLLFNDVGGYGISAPYVPSDIKAIVPLGYINAATDDVAGEDLAVHYTGPDLGVGRFRADMEASYFNKYNYQLAADAPTTSFLNTVLNPLRLRAKANVGWTKNGWDVNARINFSNKYRNTSNGTTSSCADDCSISSWTTVDFGLSYAPLPSAVPRWLEDTRVAVIVTNAFNRAPPSVTGLTPTQGYDPFNANPLLRTFGVTFAKRWGAQDAR
jgi:iron complex outermembrane recepter protein